LGHSRKHPYHPHRGNMKLTPLPPSDVLIHLLLSETIFSPLPLCTAEISSVGGVWIFSGTTHYSPITWSITGLQINIWLYRTFVRSLLILVGHNLNLVGQRPTPLYMSQDIYISHETSLYSHSGATLSKMLECLVNFIANCKLSEFAIGFCHSKKCIIWQFFFVIGPMSDQNYFCSDICQI
jgi:hypothetical protein